MIGDRFVKISFTAQRNSKTPPMVSIKIVFADDPVIKRQNFSKAILKAETKSSQEEKHVQDVSLSLKPSRSSMTPATTRKRPKKSKSWRCSPSVRPRCGFKCKLKNRSAAATPPVGLIYS